MKGCLDVDDDDCEEDEEESSDSEGCLGRSLKDLRTTVARGWGGTVCAVERRGVNVRVRRERREMGRRAIDGCWPGDPRS